MDGATAWEKFWKITFPTVTPTLLVSVIYTVLDGFTDYDNKVMQLLRSYYTNNNYTYSATIGVIYFFCIREIKGRRNEQEDNTFKKTLRKACEINFARRVFGGRGVCNALSGAVYAFKLLQIRK